jgi:hypothetical protein
VAPDLSGEALYIQQEFTQIQIKQISLLVNWTISNQGFAEDWRLEVAKLYMAAI